MRFHLDDWTESGSIFFYKELRTVLIITPAALLGGLSMGGKSWESVTT